MHFFELRNIQHFVMYIFPAIIAVFLIGAALAYTHFRKRDSEERKKEPNQEETFWRKREYPSKTAR